MTDAPEAPQPGSPVKARALAVFVYGIFYGLILLQAKLRGATGTGQTVVAVVLGVFLLLGLVGALLARDTNQRV